MAVSGCTGHLLDTERVFAYRLLRISRGDETVMTGFDEQSYIVGHTAHHLDVLGERYSLLTTRT